MKSTMLLSALVAVASLAMPPPAHGGGEHMRPRDARPLVGAHRGGAMHRPENTMAAFRHAHALGVDVLEFDMMMTADDRLVVHHDARVNPAICVPDPGTRVEPAPVRALTLAQLRGFDCGSRVRAIYDVPGHRLAPGERIPTVDEVLGEFADTGLGFFAETKVPPAEAGVPDVDPALFAARVEALVRRHGLEDRFVLQSFDYRTLDAMRALNPRITTCLLGPHRHTRDFEVLAHRHGAGCVMLREDLAEPADAERLRKAGIRVYMGGNPEERWTRNLLFGADVLVTDRPGELIGHLRSKGLRD